MCDGGWLGEGDRHGVVNSRGNVTIVGARNVDTYLWEEGKNCILKLIE